MLAAGQVSIAAARSQFIRTAIGLFFAVPAAVAGYHAALVLARIAIPGEVWRQILALGAAIIVAATAWARLRFSTPPDPGQASRPVWLSRHSASGDRPGRLKPPFISRSAADRNAVRRT